MDHQELDDSLLDQVDQDQEDHDQEGQEENMENEEDKEKEDQDQEGQAENMEKENMVDEDEEDGTVDQKRLGRLERSLNSDRRFNNRYQFQFIIDSLSCQLVMIRFIMVKI